MSKTAEPAPGLKMSDPSKPGSIFDRLGVKPVINACGVYTDLGGSVLSPGVWAAMADSNRSFVSMIELLDRTGAVLAERVGAEAARVTPGASAAIALGTAACLTGMDGEKWERLPDTTGMPKSEFVIQHGHRYKYDRCARLAGARLVEIGGPGGTTPDELASALGPKTGVILHPAHLDDQPGSVRLPDVSRIARARGVPVFVDAAYSNDPQERMRTFIAAGADLVCFSAKYFGGPNAGGFIAGRADLMAAVTGVDFTRYESGKYLKFGRAFKLDRQIVVGVAAALEEWLAMDHAARWAGYRRKAEAMVAALAGASGIVASAEWFTMDERLVTERANCAVLRFLPGSPHTAASVSAALLAGDPKIATVVLDGVLVAGVDSLLDGQEEIVARELRRVLSR
jgi:D-glucosaminate-6-phosphate ammonia-lyase